MLSIVIKSQSKIVTAQTFPAASSYQIWLTSNMWKKLRTEWVTIFVFTMSMLFDSSHLHNLKLFITTTKQNKTKLFGHSTFLRKNFSLGILPISTFLTQIMNTAVALIAKETCSREEKHYLIHKSRTSHFWVNTIGKRAHFAHLEMSMIQKFILFQIHKDD